MQLGIEHTLAKGVEHHAPLDLLLAVDAFPDPL